MGTSIAGLVAGVLVIAGLPQTNTAEQPLLAVRIVLWNDNAVRADVAAAARAEVARLYKLIDVDIVWVTEPAAVSRDLRYIKLTTRAPERDRSPNALGMVPAEPGKRGVFGYVFWRRIRLLSVKCAVDAEALLPAVIAHEIGHMLLPEGSHSTTGLMRGAWSVEHCRSAATGNLHFERESASLIRRGLLPPGAALE